MITVVTNLNGALGSVYSVLLIFAMIGASLASLFPIAEIFKKSKVKQVVSCTLISILCVALSSFGFKELISTVYPAFGYIGFIVIAMVLSRYFKKDLFMYDLNINNHLDVIVHMSENMYKLEEKCAWGIVGAQS